MSEDFDIDEEPSKRGPRPDGDGTLDLGKPIKVGLPQIFAAGGLVVALGVGNFKVDGLEHRVAELAARLDAHERAPGHREEMARVEALTLRLERVEGDVRDLGAELNSKVDLLRENMASLCTVLRPRCK